ncbi:hypothetical protein CC80DRAFT_159028 [Byssothecium circinans]|uniref:Uncharacterized protein n=1 Tax=Byssothecium circinans TaxID=147558 RepID=A0A6A5UEZ4_9PLEO|nr:hypothetical protein CC80DRAFT_159028 [Byssothecium circinans]
MTLSLLESFPTELIQPIFLLSGPNLALPLASPHIAAKLSEDYIYNEICTNYLTQRGTYDRIERSKNQTRLFAAKWMTWDFFKTWITKTYEPKGCLCGRTKEEGCFDEQWPPNWEDVTTMVFSRSHLPALAWVKCRLPSKLLRGPWTKEKIEFLRFMLWMTSATVDWADEDVRRMALEGKQEAILQGNLEVVEIFNHNRRLGRAPTLTSVRFAVIEAGCNRSIVYDTMATARAWGLKGNAWNSNGLDAWCAERTASGDPKGAWLQTKLQELRTVTHTRNNNDDEGGNGEGSSEGAGAGAGNVSTTYGTMKVETGDYDGGDEDRLVVNKHKWIGRNILLFCLEPIHVHVWMISDHRLRFRIIIFRPREVLLSTPLLCPSLLA